MLEDLSFTDIKTKNVVQFLNNFKADDTKALFVTAETNDFVEKSARNIPGVKTIMSGGINVFDILHHDRIFVTKEAVAKIEEVLA